MNEPDGAELAIAYLRDEDAAALHHRSVWPPPMPATMDADRVESFGGHPPFGRAAQPDEIAPSYLFFAAAPLSSYYSGEVLAPIGGETHPG